MNEHESRFGGSGSGRLDRAIDRAVRDLMWIDPAPGLRRRVLSRLDAPVRGLGFLPRFAVVAATLAVLVVAAVLLRNSGTRPQVGQPSVVATATPAVAQPANSPVRQPSKSAPSPSGIRTPARRDGRIRMPAITNIFGPANGRISSATVPDPVPAEIVQAPSIDAPPDDRGAAAAPSGPAA